jgi:hypothetical protein
MVMHFFKFILFGFHRERGLLAAGWEIAPGMLKDLAPSPISLFLGALILSLITKLLHIAIVFSFHSTPSIWHNTFYLNRYIS